MFQGKGGHMKQKQVPKIILSLLLLVLVSLSGYKYLNSQTINQNPSVASLPEPQNQSTDNLTTTKSNETENKIITLQNKYNNPEVQAIISIENEDFSYPVAQTTDNDFYLTHDYAKNKVSLGAIYADYRVDLDNSHKKLIYGHSSTKTNTPFNTLEKYYNKDYYQNHKYITLETTSHTYRYEIFSVYVETSDFTYMNMNFDTPKEWYAHLLKLQGKSMYPIDVKLEKDSDILIMQTCSNLSKYKKYSKKYLLIASRRVEE